MTKQFLIDLAERVITTYVEALVGLLIVGWIDFTSVSEALNFGRSAAIAAIPAALAVLKGGLARLHGNPNSASLVGAEPDPSDSTMKAGN